MRSCRLRSPEGGLAQDTQDTQTQLLSSHRSPEGRRQRGPSQLPSTPGLSPRRQRHGGPVSAREVPRMASSSGLCWSPHARSPPHALPGSTPHPSSRPTPSPRPAPCPTRHTYLEGAQPQLEHEPLPLADVLRGEGEHRVVDPEQRDEQQGGPGQPSVGESRASAPGATRARTTAMGGRESQAQPFLLSQSRAPPSYGTLSLGGLGVQPPVCRAPSL